MTAAPGQEETLLALVRARERGPRTLERVRARIRRTHQLSASFIGFGFVGFGAVLIVRGLASYMWSLEALSSTWLTGAGWLLVIGAFVASVWFALARRGDLPTAAYIAVLVVDLVAVLVEYVDYSTSAASATYYPSVCVGIGATLMALITFHPLVRTYQGIALVLFVCVCAQVLQSLFGSGGGGIGIGNILLSVAPVGSCAAILSTLDQHVFRKLDRTITDSMINAPSTGTGRLAASDLADIDASVEALLEEVTRGGSGPLDAELGARGRLLGDELRAALARSHDQTWLRIAVGESAHLSDAVTIIDPFGLAATLRPPDRSRLLSAFWLLASPTLPVRPRIELAVGTRPLTKEQPSPAGIMLTISVSDTRPKDMDTAVWSVLSELGSYRVTTEPGTTYIHVAHPGTGKPAS